MNKNRRHSIWYVSLFILIISSFCYAEESVNKQQAKVIYDLFSGTITQDKDQLILHRCSIARDQFLLDFNHPEDEIKIRRLIQQDSYFWLNLRARAYENNKIYRLRVEGISAVHLKKSCHLSDLLSDLDKPPKVKPTNRE